ncbi:MAG: hypothetical protein HPY74_12750 [Firmicutes bacterium]|nr:hypothetical protein [Bacillota bacterium]
MDAEENMLFILKRIKGYTKQSRMYSVKMYKYKDARYISQSSRSLNLGSFDANEKRHTIAHGYARALLPSSNILSSLSSS